MGKHGRRALVLLLAALSLFVIAACGDDDDDGGDGGGGGGGGKSGGSITISQTSQPDHLDPALIYTVNAHRAAVARVHAADHLPAHRRRQRRTPA